MSRQNILLTGSAHMFCKLQDWVSRMLYNVEIIGQKPWWHNSHEACACVTWPSVYIGGFKYLITEVKPGLQEHTDTNSVKICAMRVSSLKILIL